MAGGDGTVHWAMFNLHHQQYFWLDESKSAPYLNRKGKKEQTTAHWVIEGLRG